MKAIVCAILMVLSTATLANTYIQFGQFDKVRAIWFASGGLYACSKDDAHGWEKRHSFQFMHFKLLEVATDYFKFAYQAIAIQDVPVAERSTIVDAHRKVESERLAHEQEGFGSIGGDISCEAVTAFAAEVFQYQE